MAQLSQREQDLRLVWRVGQIRYLLDSCQRDIYEQYHRTKSRKFVVNCSRRLGKSYLLVLLAIEKCIQQPGAQVRYAAPAGTQVVDIIKPLMGQILEDCPKDLLPQWRSAGGALVFPNGSELHVAGCDNGNAERLRGGGADLVIVDEAGSIKDLKYVVSDILMPQLLTTEGRMILASTPPTTMAHPFATYAEEAEREGYYVHRTIYDNPRLTPERIEEFIVESGGISTTTWKREYLAQFVVETDFAVVPEFPDLEAELVQAVERPPYYDAYVGMDLGFVDLTVVLFGYWDFLGNRLVIDDEVVMNRMTTETLATAIKAKEKELWRGKPPFLRVSDVDHIVINDLAKLHGIKFIATRKDDKEAQVNALRLLVTQRKLRIHPRCKTLIAHLRHAIWNEQRTKFERSDERGFSHFDAVDALVYLVRNVQRGRNPYPVLDPSVDPSTHHIPPGLKNATHADRKVRRMLKGAYSRRVGH